jgi:hypothetical protein
MSRPTISISFQRGDRNDAKVVEFREAVDRCGFVKRCRATRAGIAAWSASSPARVQGAATRAASPIAREWERAAAFAASLVTQPSASKHGIGPVAFARADVVHHPLDTVDQTGSARHEAEFTVQRPVVTAEDNERSRAFWIHRVAEMQRALRKIIRTPNRELHPWTAKKIARGALSARVRR